MYDFDVEAGKVAQLLNLFNGQIQNLPKALKIMDDRMVLLNPRYDKTKDKKNTDLEPARESKHEDSEDAGEYSEPEGRKQQARD